MKPGNVFLVAILVGALAAAMGVRYVHNLQQQIAEIRNSGNRPTVDVVVAADQIPIGARVEVNQVKLVAWPVEAQPEGTARATKDVVGSIARVTRSTPIARHGFSKPVARWGSPITCSARTRRSRMAKSSASFGRSTMSASTYGGSSPSRLAAAPSTISSGTTIMNDRISVSPA